MRHAAAASLLSRWMRAALSAATDDRSSYKAWAYLGLGDIDVARGNLPDALKSYRDGLAIRDRLAKADPGNAGWQRDLSVSYAKLGVAFRKAGRNTDALSELRDGQAIMARMTRLSPDNAQWKQDLVWFNDQITQLTK